MTDVKSELLEGGVALITIDRPAALNAMSRVVRAELAQALASADANDDVQVVVITGAGDRAFSAGLDLRELGSDPDALQEVASEDPIYNPVAAVDQCAKPIIAAVNGVCVTGALEVVLACDIVLCAERARFADTHAKVGLLPVWGLSQRLSRLIGPMRASEMSLTGNFISSKTAAGWGLVTRVVPDDRVIEEALAIARAIAVNDQLATRANKALMKSGFRLPLGAALEHERSVGAEFNASVTPTMLEARRRALTASSR